MLKKCLFGIFLIFVVINIANSCDVSGGIFTLSKGKACVNDTIIVSISNISGCRGYEFTVKYDGTELCSTKSEDTFAACAFRITQNGTYNITGCINNICFKKEFNISEPTSYLIFYDWKGRELEPDECTDRNPKRKWREVKLISLPLHFSFGIRNESEITQSPDIKCNDTTYRNFTFGVSCYEGTEQLCAYDTHNITRYVYNWNYSYDLGIFMMDRIEMVPMLIGKTQKSIKGSNFPGGCDENNSLCYTEVPLCGDGICDTIGGERCWNCPQDCFGGSTSEFEGDCTKNGCSRCPTNYPDFLDARGCVIEYRQRNEMCECNDMCGKGLVCVTKYYGEGKTARERGNKNNLIPGRCCKHGELWNELRDRCEVKRGVIVEEIKFEFVTESFGIFSNKRWCCPNRPDAGWVRVRITVRNIGDLDEEVEITAGFPQETTTDIFGRFFSLDQTQGATIPAGGRVDFVMVWDCVRTSRIACPSLIKCDQLGVCEGGTGPDYSPTFRISIVVENRTKTAPFTNTESSIIGLDEYFIECDTHTLYCSNGIKIKKTDNSADFEVMCGGTDLPGKIPAPALKFVADCDPFY